MEHTALPWSAEETDGNLAKVVYRPGDGLRSVIARLYDNSLCNEHGGDVNANAQYIVQACNAYPVLVEALEAAIEQLNASRLGYIDTGKINRAYRLAKQALAHNNALEVE